MSHLHRRQEWAPSTRCDEASAEEARQSRRSHSAVDGCSITASSGGDCASPLLALPRYQPLNGCFWHTRPYPTARVWAAYRIKAEVGSVPAEVTVCSLIAAQPMRHRIARRWILRRVWLLRSIASRMRWIRAFVGASQRLYGANYVKWLC